MKVDIVLILGPSDKFNPLKGPKFALPFLNLPLLNLSMKFKIFIFCLDQHYSLASTMLKNYKIPIEFITTSSYEGMAYILNKISKKITSPYFIMTKRDIYGQESLRPLIEAFSISDDDLYVAIEKINNNSTNNSILSIDSNDRLIGYQDGKIPFVKNTKITVTSEFILRDFFIIRTSSINQIPENLYGFKNNVIPFLIKEHKKIRVIENLIFQIKDFKDYLKQLDFKNTLLGCSDGTEYNLLDNDCEIDEGSHIENSIIGSKVKIEKNTTIKGSIIMDNAKLECNKKYEKCIVDSNSNIYKF